MSIVRQSKTLFIKKQSKTAPMHSVHTFISHTKLPLLVIPIGVRRLPAHTSGLLRLFCTQKASHVHTPRWCHPGHMKIRQTHRSHLPDHSNAQPGSLTSDGRWCSHRGLMRRGLYSLGCFWLYNRCMCTYSGGSTQDPTTTRSRRRSHLSDRSTACRCTITKKR